MYVHVYMLNIVYMYFSGVSGKCDLGCHIPDVYMTTTPGVVIWHSCAHTHSCLQPVLLQLAQKGSPDLAKHAVKCIHSVFKEPKPILMRLFTVRNRKV